MAGACLKNVKDVSDEEKKDEGMQGTVVWI